MTCLFVFFFLFCAFLFVIASLNMFYILTPSLVYGTDTVFVKRINNPGASSNW